MLDAALGCTPLGAAWQGASAAKLEKRRRPLRLGGIGQGAGLAVYLLEPLSLHVFLGQQCRLLEKRSTWPALKVNMAADKLQHLRPSLGVAAGWHRLAPLLCRWDQPHPLRRVQAHHFAERTAIRLEIPAQNAFDINISYVRPEPVLVKWSILCVKLAQERQFSHRGMIDSTAPGGWERPESPSSILTSRTSWK